MMSHMTKLLRLPAIVLLLMTAACQTSSPSAEVSAKDTVSTDIPCNTDNDGATMCSGSGAPATLLTCYVEGPDLSALIPGTWLTQECQFGCLTQGGNSSCAQCVPGTSSCDDGNRVVCGANGTWLPGGTCRANACQCGGKWPHCDVCN